MPYDITQMVADENNKKVIKMIIYPNFSEPVEEFFYGVFLVKKVDHNKLIANFKSKLPLDAKFTLDLGKRRISCFESYSFWGVVPELKAFACRKGFAIDQVF